MASGKLEEVVVLLLLHQLTTGGLSLVSSVMANQIIASRSWKRLCLSIPIEFVVIEDNNVLKHEATKRRDDISVVYTTLLVSERGADQVQRFLWSCECECEALRPSASASAKN